MFDSLSATPPITTSPWLLLWFKPRAAIGAVLRGGGEKTAIALAALFGVAVLAQNLGGFWQLFSPPMHDAAVAAFVFSLGAPMGVIGLHLSGWLYTLILKLFGGKGDRRATRAAIAWSAPPALFPYLLMATGLAAEWPGGVIALYAVMLIGAIWTFILLIFMLAEAHTLAADLAFVATLFGHFTNFVLALVIALAIRITLFQPFFAASTSMAPTLNRDDEFFISKFAYGYSRFSLPGAPAIFNSRIFARQPRRGEVIAYFDAARATSFVKRIVGLPGDRVQMRSGRLYLNDEIVPRRPIEPRVELTTRNGMGKVPTYVETLPDGVEYKIAKIDDDRGFLDNTRLFETPPGTVFVLGDNRDNSTDSRVPPEKEGPGFVSIDAIIGRAEFIHLRRAAGAPATRRRLTFEWIDGAAR